MSRLAKKPIQIPEKAEVSFSGNALTVKGPVGTLSREFHPSVALAIDGKEIRVSLREGSKDFKAHLGTSVAHIKNMLSGTIQPFVKKLIVEGIGFKAELKGNELIFALGFSHPVKVAIPQDVKVTAEKNVITVSGADIEKVGQFTAKLRMLRPPEPYKGKGIRYENEVVRRKQGKKTV